MDAVLGLSMTPTSVGLVLVEGQDADGATMDRDAFTVARGAVDTSAQATAAVLRTEAAAATRGLRMHAIGVTWSEDSDAEASRLLQSLSDSGFDNVVAIRMPEATEALARGIAEVLGYATTAVCVVEPDQVITLIVNTSDGAVQTAFNHAIDSDDALVGWLSNIFTRADWTPEALVVVGSAGDFEPLLPRLEEVLSVPVFAPAEAELALARGAALASAQSVDLPVDAFDAFDADGGRYAAYDTRDAGPAQAGTEHRRRTLLAVGPAAMLAVGVVTFVVSVSIAVSLQLTPARESGSNEPVAAANAEAPVAARPNPPIVAPPVVLPPAPAPEQVLPPPPEAPPVNEPAPVAITDVPAEAPGLDQAPAAQPDPVPAYVPPVDPPQAPPAYTPPMAGTPLPPVYTAPTPVQPTKKPGLFTRIKERLTPGPG